MEAVFCCGLVYLCVNYFDRIIGGISYLLNLVLPLLIGIILALILNIPMSMFERLLRKKTGMKKGIRGLSITLALLLIIAIFAVVIVLVAPELVNAVKLIVQIVNEGIDGLDHLEENTAFAENPVGKALSEIDWSGLKVQLEDLISANSSDLVDRAVSATGSIVSHIVTFVLAVVFSVYILASKEKLKNQSGRLIRAWLPQEAGGTVLHICAVCSSTFQHFIGGAAIEAVILGTLCMIGMLILRIPYAAMIGAMVAVTAMIPIVGAYISAIIGAVMILTVKPIKALVFLIFFVILQETENNLIYPRVVGSKINLPAMWVLAAVMVGGSIGGPVGMLLGVPAASAAYTLLREATQKRELKLKQRQDRQKRDSENGLA
ncbi:MAG: AI-2E family transporter [Lachnospiraceae bacterium]|nr:AI-2E family transporter [Lachnospiraceae bacterium]